MTRVTAYLHSSKEEMSDAGEEHGLSGGQLDNFCYSLYEVKFELEVDDDGSAQIVSVNDSPLVTPVDA